MMPRVFLLIVLACMVQDLLSHHAGAAVKTSVALTITSPVTAPAANRELMASLSTLVEMNLLADDSLAVVERQELSLPLQELALSKSRTADDSLRLGKLVTADMMIMQELRAPDQKSSKPSALLRVVESRTAVIRGVMVISDLDESILDEAAGQLARYATSVIHEPQRQTVTVAVVPFESVGRFDRLRPLELGIRELVAARLLVLSQTVEPQQQPPVREQPANAPETAESVKPSTGLPKSDRPAFQVLQRSSLEHLLRELDFVETGFADESRLPRTLPNREAAFLIKGEIDERQTDGVFKVIVRGELRHAASAKVRDSFEFECTPAELESRLIERVDAFAKHLGLVVPHRAKGRADEESEADSLKKLALRDLHRFRRQCPIDFSFRAFSMPGESWRRDVPHVVQPETPLELALLRKSIDRLETALFLRPEDAESAYALGFCYSIHQAEICRLDRADELLRSVAARRPGSPLAANALVLLSELSFDDRSGRFEPLSRGARRDRESMKAASQKAAERAWLAFEMMPESSRDDRWSRIPELFARLNLPPEQTAGLLSKTVPYAERAEDHHRRQLIAQVQQTAQRLAAQSRERPALKALAIETMRNWGDAPATDLAISGRLGLAAIHENDGEFLEAARLREAIAATLKDAVSADDQHQRQWQLTQAARCYRVAKDPERALRLLQSFEPQSTRNSLLVGQHGYEKGVCLETLGTPRQALAAYLTAAELCPSIVFNSNLVERVIALGGVPRREDREIDVTYLQDAGPPATYRCLATDGQRLFAGGRGVFVMESDQRTWSPLKADLEDVLCLKIHNGWLWAGTRKSGLWRCDLKSGDWTSFGAEQGLPDPQVESLAFHDTDLFAGTGTAAAGGLVRIDERGRVSLLDDPQAPHVVPTHLVVTEHELLARTLTTIHRYSWPDKTWSQLPAEQNRPTPMASRLFAGSNGAWASNYGHELMRWGADDEANQFFKPAWYFAPGTKAGYLVNFVAERGDEVWFGGEPWNQFLSSGLYRVHLKTGTFVKFTPADGFASVRVHSVLGGVWLKDRLWLATSSGLCVVTPRNERRMEYAP